MRERNARGCFVKGLKIIITCVECGNKKSVDKSRFEAGAKFCGNECSWLFNRKNPNAGSFSIRRPVGDKHPRWIKKPSYLTLHKWASRHIQSRHSICELCGLKKPLHAANRSGKYIREIGDYFALCALCHRWFDRYFCGNKLTPLSKLRTLRLRWYQETRQKFQNPGTSTQRP